MAIYKNNSEKNNSRSEFSDVSSRNRTIRKGKEQKRNSLHISRDFESRVKKNHKQISSISNEKDDAHSVEINYHDYEYGTKKAEKTDTETVKSHILCGRNPIREALRSGREIEKLLVQKGELSGSAREIVQEARASKIMVQEVDRRHLDEMAPNHQGLIAIASAYHYSTLESILISAEEKNEPPFLVILDGITDPHNLGAIIRTAECTGVHGIIIPQHRSVGLTPAAVKSSAGAIEHLKVAKVTNLNRTIDELKKRGIWIYAVTMNGENYENADFRNGTALVIGAEGEGISRLTMEKCDIAVSLPLIGCINSLNASVAAGVMMYKVLSCRKKK